MAINLLDLTAEIVSAHASMTEMTSDDLIREINLVHATLEAIAGGGKPVVVERSGGERRKWTGKMKEPAEQAEAEPAAPPAPAMTIAEAFKPDQVACMVCGKSGMVTLKRHLASAHGLKPGQYRKQFKIPREQPLAAVEYVAKRRQAALDKGLGTKLAAARAARKPRELGE